jgi:hypothetical protein
MRMILIEIGSNGVRRVSTRVHSADGQRQAALLVSKLAPAIANLDRAVKEASASKTKE